MRTYDESSETVGSEIVLHAALDVDDHASPSLLVRDSDHKLLVFYSVHDGPTMFLRVSATSLDTDPDLSDGFASEQNLDASLGGTDYTYPVPIQLTGEANDPIYLFYRDITSAPTQQLVYNKSTDGGATWGSRVLVYQQSGRSSYWKISRNGDARIDFGISDGHPAVDAAPAIYHFYYEGGAYFESDGSSAGSLPLDTSDLTLVASGATTMTWVQDSAVDGSGHPVLVWVRYATAVSDLRYMYGRWDGAAWDVNEMAAAGASISAVGGSNYYAGGIALDQADPSIVYASLDTGTQMWRYVTGDGGASWSSAMLEDGGSTKLIRPVCPINASILRALYMKGTYTSFTNWSTGTSGVR